MTHSTVVVALLIAVAGCAASEPPAPKAAPESSMSFDYLFPKPGERSGPACPAAIPGVRVASIPTDKGMMFVFTTEQGVTEVRRRARAFAAELDEEPGGEAAPAPEPRRLGGIETSSRYEEIPEGATVEVSAVRPDDSLALRDQLDDIGRRMQAEHNCPDELLLASL